MIPLFRRELKSLQGESSILRLGKIEPGHLSHLLTSHKGRFKCGSEIKKRSTFWGLRKVAPPAVPNKHGLLTSAFGSCGSGQYFTASNGGTINYKCKLESKKQQLKRQHSSGSMNEEVRQEVNFISVLVSF